MRIHVPQNAFYKMRYALCIIYNERISPIDQEITNFANTKYKYEHFR